MLLNTLVRRVVAVPGDDVEGREALGCAKQFAPKLLQNFKGAGPLLIPGHRRLEVPRICQTVGACTVTGLAYWMWDN